MDTVKQIFAAILMITLFMGIFLAAKAFVDLPVDDYENTSATLTVDEPNPNSLLAAPCVINGKTKILEGPLNYRIVTNSGKILSEGLIAIENQLDDGNYQDYEVTLATLGQPDSFVGRVEVFNLSRQTGEIQNLVIVPVRFQEPQEVSFQLFFPKIGDEDCKKVYPVKRTFNLSDSIEKAVVSELLSGPTTIEVQEGFFTNIPTSTELLSVTVVDEVARADFSSTLVSEELDDCHAQNIRAQIEETLKQLPGIRIVAISVDGKILETFRP